MDEIRNKIYDLAYDHLQESAIAAGTDKIMLLIQQEIAKAKEQERNNIIEYVQVNRKGQFEEDSTGSACWYLDDLIEILKKHKEK